MCWCKDNFHIYLVFFTKNKTTELHHGVRKNSMLYLENLLVFFCLMAFFAWLLCLADSCFGKVGQIPLLKVVLKCSIDIHSAIIFETLHCLTFIRISKSKVNSDWSESYQSLKKLSKVSFKYWDEGTDMVKYLLVTPCKIPNWKNDLWKDAEICGQLRYS